MSEENNFELDKFCPSCKKTIILCDNKQYYYCGNYFNCNLNYHYYFNENKISMDELITGYGWIKFTNIDKTNFSQRDYKYVFYEPNFSLHEILEKYNEFMENLIFL